MKTLLMALTIMTTISTGKVLASPPPFVCSVFTEWELASRTDLTESEIAARKSVITLLNEAEIGSGPTLDLLKAEISKKDPSTKITNSEIAERLVQINSIGYFDSPCFDMIEKGLSFTAQLIKP